MSAPPCPIVLLSARHLAFSFMQLFIILTTVLFFFFFQAEDGIRDLTVTGVQTCALPILRERQGRADLLCRIGRDDRGEAKRPDVNDKMLLQTRLFRKQTRLRSRELSRKIGRASCRERV